MRGYRYKLLYKLIAKEERGIKDINKYLNQFAKHTRVRFTNCLICNSIGEFAF